MALLFPFHEYIRPVVYVDWMRTLVADFERLFIRKKCFKVSQIDFLVISGLEILQFQGVNNKGFMNKHGNYIGIHRDIRKWGFYGISLAKRSSTNFSESPAE